MTQSPPPVPRRTLGGLEDSALGLGCPGMSRVHGAADRAESPATVHRALDLGVTFLDTSDVDGDGHDEELVGEALAAGRADVQLAATSSLRHDDRGGVARGGRYAEASSAYGDSLERAAS